MLSLSLYPSYIHCQTIIILIAFSKSIQISRTFIRPATFKEVLLYIYYASKVPNLYLKQPAAPPIAIASQVAIFCRANLLQL